MMSTGESVIMIPEQEEAIIENVLEKFWENEDLENWDTWDMTELRKHMVKLIRLTLGEIKK